MDTPETGCQTLPEKTDVVIVGAGFSGLYLIYLMRQHGFSAVAIEAASEVGGTWYWNRYPGARCDIESMQYSYGFDKALEQEWDWSERYAPQPEILAYARHVADRHDLCRDIRFGRQVVSAVYDEGAAAWTLTTDKGESVTAQYCIMATGCLSVPNAGVLAGEESFSGPIYRTSRWPHERVDFSGLRVGVVGTGSSGIQCIPAIAAEAAEVTVFQRTANYAIPAWNHPLDAAARDAIKADYAGLRARQKDGFGAADFGPPPELNAVDVAEAEREAVFERFWQRGGLGFRGAFADLTTDPAANEAAADFVRRKIRETVTDPAVADLLSPTNTFACKRLCVDTDYYRTYNLPHVHLIDVSRAPPEVTATGIRTGGTEHEFDALVLATGFDAMTGALLRIDIRGRDGLTLAAKWAEGPKTYLGLAMAGFPNLFTVTGPGSPSVLTNMLGSIEHHCEWITDCICAMRAADVQAIEAETSAEEAWIAHNRELSDGALRAGCASWYTGENIAGKPRVYMPYLGGFPAYSEKCAEVAANGFEGFRRAPD